MEVDYHNIKIIVERLLEKMVERQSLKKAIEKLKSPAVVSFGNPLLDVAVILNDDNFLEKYGLSVEGEMELPEDKIQEIMADLSPE